MNKLSLWSPFNWVTLPIDEFDEENFISNTQIPPMDIIDEGDKILVKLHIPGFDKDNIKISIENTKLTISGSVEQSKVEEKKKYYRREIRSQQSFTRSCTLPSEVESENAIAEFKDGVLQISLPKTQKVKPKTIAIS